MHTRLPEDPPPRRLAPGCNVPSVATATGKNILIIHGPKSKDNAVTLGWEEKWKQKEKMCQYPGTLYKAYGSAVEFMFPETKPIQNSGVEIGP